MNKKIFIFLCSFIMTSSLIGSENKKKDNSGKWSIPTQVVVKSHKPKRDFLSPVRRVINNTFQRSYKNNLKKL